MIDEGGDDGTGLVERERRFGPDGLFLQGAVEPFQFAVGLRVVRRSQHMAGLPEADELLEILGDELRPAVTDDARTGLGTAPAPVAEPFRRRFPSSPPGFPNGR